MKKGIILVLFALFISQPSNGKGVAEKFLDPEKNFKFVLEKILTSHVDGSVTKESLYRAATQGVLQSLNSGKGAWNRLYSPSEYRTVKSDVSGTVTGIGIAIKFNEATGHGLVLKALAQSAAESAGIKSNDIILSVDGDTFKGKPFLDLVKAIRGEVGKKVTLKVLRGDKILTKKIKRKVISWSPVDLEAIGQSTALLTIGFFNAKTPSLVQAKLEEAKRQKYERLIVDLRGNQGGAFKDSLKVAEMFLSKNSRVVIAKDRSGKKEEFKAKSDGIGKELKIVVLTDKETSSGAEICALAIKENLGATVVGETTVGKWNAQSLEKLPNGWAMKYTVKEFLSPDGKNYQGVGVKPDFEVHMPEAKNVQELRTKYKVKQRLEEDNQLKVALELITKI
jgi:carboxyl-terminal processing protease